MKVARRIAGEMKKHGIIRNDEYNVYVYGLELVVLKFIAGLIAIIVSIALNTTLFLFALLLFLIPIREYAGGVHAASRGACLFLTEMILLVAQLIWKWNLWKETLQILAILLCMIAVLLFAPSQNEKRRLSQQKRKKFRYISILLCFINVACYGMAFWIGWNLIKIAISLAMMIEAILLILYGIERLKKSLIS
ncbi:MAG: accessory gene regulator B family protein [Lachnospiraceae bacterium]|nr:accessory gene regulator B family protein [Lachnospiraceae bacterium]MBR3507878.1 accessory gene regulator B family protein [Lachnospiraceae bacterium]